MKLTVPTFKGEAPRISARLLPDDMSQQALNCRLVDGDLRGWRNFRTEAALCKGPTVNTVYLLEDQYWLEWTDAELGDGAVEVDVAKSTIAGDLTGRIYFTGTDLPRWTNVALATEGSGCYPISSRPLGVPGPLEAPTLASELAVNAPISVDDNFGSGASWTLVPEFVGPFTIKRAEIVGLGGGSPTEGYLELTAQEIGPAGNAVYAYRDAGVGASATVEYAFDYVQTAVHSPYSEFNAGVYFMCDANGNGPRIGWGTDGIGVFRASYSAGTTWLNGGSTLSIVPVSSLPALGVTYRVTVSASRRANGNYDVRLVVQHDADPAIIDETFANVPVGGGYIGHLIGGSLNADRGPLAHQVRTVSIRGSAPTANIEDDTATSYVYTWVNDLGEESAPSPASVTIVRDEGTEVVVTTPTTVPAEYADFNVIYKRIYRAVTSTTGTAFQFVAEIYLASPTYNDSLADSQLGEELETSNWDLPPANLRGILALPNDIYVGFFENTLCFSVQGRPHAWPVEYRLATDARIVGIGNIDTTVVIFTVGFPYLASGNSPDAYSMTKLEVPQGCVSKRSIAYLRGLGVVGATPDGLLAIAGPGSAQIITEGLFSRENWQAINPATLIATAHDDRYVAFYDNGDKRGMLLDPKGFGKVTLGFHARAVFSDLESDNLYLVLDENVTPGTGSGQVSPSGATIYEFDAETPDSGLTPYLPFSWLSKLWQLPHPQAFRYFMARARRNAYGNTEIAFYADGELYFTTDATTPNARRLPLDVTPPDDFQLMLSCAGNGEIISGVEVADEPEEFAL